MLSLQQFLVAVLGGTFALGPLFYWIIERTQERGLCNIEPQWRRLVVAIACGAAGLAAWSLAVWLGYIAGATGRQAIAESIWNYGILTGLSAFVGSQVTHSIKATPTTPHIVPDEFLSPTSQ